MWKPHTQIFLVATADLKNPALAQYLLTISFHNYGRPLMSGYYIRQRDPRKTNLFLKYIIIKLISIKTTAWKHPGAEHSAIKSNMKIYVCSEDCQEQHHTLVFYFYQYCYYFYTSSQKNSKLFSAFRQICHYVTEHYRSTPCSFWEQSSLCA